MTEYRWLLADSAWWGQDTWWGRCALPLHGGLPAGPPRARDQVPESARATRLPGTLLPGLHDAHVHSGLVELRKVRAGGIARVDDLGSGPTRIAELLAHEDPSLPVCRFAGAMLTAPGGYPSTRDWAQPDLYRQVTSGRDARLAVAEQRDLGAKSIKITLHTRAGPVLEDDVLRVIVDTAHEHGLDVVAHAEGADTFATVLSHGVDRLAHVPWTERVDEAALAAARDMVWISTLDIHGHGHHTAELECAQDNLRRFREHGGTVRYGTDLGNGPLPLGVNAREITAMQQAGMSVDDVLLAMTDPDLCAPPCVIPEGLDADPAGLATALSTARVVGDTVGEDLGKDRAHD
ncbi:Imidazolonepropionase [Actinopolyspora mzabensis]|uniref:Imidazolonepropionase n=1 Tax=Actinopolyspora mzabensis TaxID=995066 RepID=A0A1G8Y916_ACTMZ|nr:amidohydrolase [Actinopolyspora mzabensis]SDJ98715.1 Imidazolonepropionase [Actinopolyspora mzabensis]